jgi:hypothetical protein
MEYEKYFKYFCLLILGLSTVVVYLILTNHYTSILQSLNIPFRISDKSKNFISENISLINQTENIFKFESHLSDYYPRLPIHIFTQNLSLISNITKLILLGNGFFGDRDWGFAAPGRSSTQISKNYSIYSYISLMKFFFSFQ